MAPESALGLLSALSSFPAAVYYARALGAAAVHPVRAPSGRITALRYDARYAGTLLCFVGGTALAWAVVAVLNAAFGYIAAERAAFGALLVATLWRHCPDRIASILLLILLLLAAAAGVVVERLAPEAIASGSAIGLASAGVMRWSVGWWTSRFARAASSSSSQGRRQRPMA